MSRAQAKPHACEQARETWSLTSEANPLCSLNASQWRSLIETALDTPVDLAAVRAMRLDGYTGRAVGSVPAEPQAVAEEELELA